MLFVFQIVICREKKTQVIQKKDKGQFEELIFMFHYRSIVLLKTFKRFVHFSIRFVKKVDMLY